jgi:hypothetical protein
MSTLTSKPLVTGFLFVLTLVSGLWLSSSGKPYNSVIFNIHKLIALLTTILIGVAIYNLYKTASTRPMLEIGAVIITGLLLLFLFISGGMLSIGKPEHSAILAVHRIVPLLACIFAALTVYLLIQRQIR